jgi:hypothetical protein
VLRVAREVFDALNICTGCATPPELAGAAITSSPQEQLHPEVSGNRVTWLDLSARSEFAGYAASTDVSGGTPSLSASANTIDVEFAGQAILTLDFNGQVVRTDGSGSQRLDQVRNVDASLAAGLGGSDTGAAWLSRGDTIKYVDPSGQVSESEVVGLAGDTITAIAAGGGTVAVGTDQGKVYGWTPGSGGFRRLGQVRGAVFDLATYAGNVLVLDDNLTSALIWANGQQVPVTDHALPFGATMTSEYAVWTEATGAIDSDVVPSNRGRFLEADLYLLSLKTGKIYNLYPVSGQQGFPSLSGRRLVWQDAAFGGDDVFTGEVPGGL